MRSLLWLLAVGACGGTVGYYVADIRPAPGGYLVEKCPIISNGQGDVGFAPAGDPQCRDTYVTELPARAGSDAGVYSDATPCASARPGAPAAGCPPVERGLQEPP